MKNKDLYTIGFFIGLTLLSIGIFMEITKETPNERVERINREANRECLQYEDEFARNCFAYWYSMIEDRD